MWHGHDAPSFLADAFFAVILELRPSIVGLEGRDPQITTERERAGTPGLCGEIGLGARTERRLRSARDGQCEAAGQ